MAPADHEFAPREGELAGYADEEVLPVELGPKHFLSGGWLDCMPAALVLCLQIVHAVLLEGVMACDELAGLAEE
jgi:hypothetical protein